VPLIRKSRAATANEAPTVEGPVSLDVDLELIVCGH
jgi:hypothetical protein